MSSAKNHQNKQTPQRLHRLACHWKKISYRQEEIDDWGMGS